MGLLTLGLSGCGKESPRGGDPTTDAGSFTVVVPKVTTMIKQSEQDEVSISVDRGDNFKSDVKITVEPPAGVTATPNSFTFKAGGDEQKVALQAAADAALGKHSVKVMADPAEGEATSTNFEVEITDKE
jgi:hypothetical protein